MDSLGALNSMWGGWSIDEGLIWAQQTIQAALAAGKAVYSLGTSGDINTTRPQRIYKAFAASVVAFTATTTNGSNVLTAIPDTSNLSLGQQVIGAGIPYGSFITAIVTNTSATITKPATASATLTATIYATTGNRNELRIIEAGAYYDHNDLGATAATPDELYPDYLTDGTNGTMNVYLWPVPRTAPLSLEMDVAVPFSTWSLVTNYQIPPGYEDAIEYALAFRLLSRFGAAVSQDIREQVMAIGMKCEARIREANARNRQQAPQAMGIAPPTGGQ